MSKRRKSDVALRDGIYYFDVGNRRIAVTALEAELSIALVGDATSIEDRARMLARYKANAEGEREMEARARR